MRNWFAFLRVAPDDFEDVKPDLLPAVRSRAYFDLNRLRAEADSGKSFSWPYQVLGEHFGVGLVYDLRDSMQSVTQGNLDAWGVTFYAAMEVAKQNLAALPAKFIGPPEGEGVYLSLTGDSYDASRLLLTDRVRQFNVKGDTIAMIPNRENLIVVGSEDVEGLAATLQLASEALNKPRPISGIALRLDDDEWTPWLPPPSHPSYNDFQQFYLHTIGHDYAEQTELLEKLHVKRGEDVFVASFSLAQTSDGTVFSYAAWTETTNTLLPKTDALMLGRLGGKPAIVQWQKAMDVVGGLMEPLDIYPPRYRVREFPNDKQLAAMGNMLK